MTNRINSKKKGSKNERDIAKFFKTWTSFEFSRVPQSGGLRWKKTDNITGDIVCSDPNHPGPFMLSVEGKSYKDLRFEHILIPNKKRVKIFDFWDQAIADAERGDKVPICFIRYNSLPKGFWFVIIPFWLYRKLGKSLKGDKIIIKQKTRKMVIIPSGSLLTISYLKLHKILTNGKKS